MSLKNKKNSSSERHRNTTPKKVITTDCQYIIKAEKNEK